jgi:hypothetical protein
MSTHVCHGRTRDAGQLCAVVSALRQPIARAVGVFALVALLPALARAQGGPPIMTDDPGTPGPGNWEINVATLVETNRQGRRLDMPRVDLNYGVGQRIQLKFELPWAAVKDAEASRSQTGLGDALLGVKWRFLGGEGTKISWSIYPQVQVNTVHSSIAKGVVEEGRQALFPTEITMELGRFAINGEVGRNFVERGHGNWVYGLATGTDVSRGLELLAEVHGEQPVAGAEPVELFANVGARQKLTRQLNLLIAAGRRVHGVPEEGAGFMVYTGLQFNLPGVFIVPGQTRP